MKNPEQTTGKMADKSCTRKMGIASVSKIAKQYDGYVEHYVEGKVFHTVIVLPT